MSKFFYFYKNKRLMNNLLISTGSIRRRMNDNSYPKKKYNKMDFKPRSMSRSYKGYKDALKKAMNDNSYQKKI